MASSSSRSSIFQTTRPQTTPRNTSLKSPVLDPTEYSRCPECQHEFKKATIEKNGGKCGRCIKKVSDEKTPKAAQRQLCQGSCGKVYTIATLKKWNQMCKNCYDKTENNSVEKTNCIRCQKETNEKTYKTYSRFCHPCVIIICKEKSVEYNQSEENDD